MTIENFKRLHEVEQDEMVTNFGSYVTNFIDGDIMYDNYKLYRFYVVFSYNLKLNKTQSILSFKNDADFGLHANTSSATIGN